MERIVAKYSMEGDNGDQPEGLHFNQSEVERFRQIFSSEELAVCQAYLGPSAKDGIRGVAAVAGRSRISTNSVSTCAGLPVRQDGAFFQYFQYFCGPHVY